MLTAIDESVETESFLKLHELERQVARKDKAHRQAYRQFVDDFEELSAIIHGRVDHAIEAAVRNSRVVFTEEWRDESRDLAEELKRHPWLVVSTECPPAYETLRLLYIEWAKCCRDLSRSLRNLTCDGDDNQPTRVRICFADEEFAAVTAHNTARRIYLDSLA